MHHNTYGMSWHKSHNTATPICGNIRQYAACRGINHMAYFIFHKPRCTSLNSTVLCVLYFALYQQREQHHAIKVSTTQSKSANRAAPRNKITALSLL